MAPQPPITVSPPTASPLLSVRDLIVCATGASDVEVDEFRAHPPIASPAELRLHGSCDPVELGRGIRIDRISDDDARAVMDACTPAGLRFSPVRQYGQRYCFVRDVDPDEHESHPFRWDPDSVMWDALAYSRLIRDNGYSTEYAARVADYADGARTIVYTPGSESKHAYRLRRDREWLDPSEGAQLASLLAAFWQHESDLPGRVRRALWRAEYATWMRWADLANSILVSGLEALLKTERHQATHQFKIRVTALADDLEIPGVTHDFCERIYDLRSDWVHGGHVALFPSGEEAEEAARLGESTSREASELATLQAVCVIQDVLRSALRRAIEDTLFADIFLEDDAIRSRWPV